MKLPMKKKKVVLRKKVVSRGSVNRGSVKVVKRGEYIHPFVHLAKKMSKSDLIKYIANINNFASPTYNIARTMLQKLYGLSQDKINQEVAEYSKKMEMIKDAKLYYNGKITAPLFISKYGHLYGIDTKDKLDAFVKNDTFEIRNKIGYQKSSPEKIVIEKRYQPSNTSIERDEYNVFTIPKKTDPAGQRPLSLNLQYDYIRMMNDLKNKRMRNEISQKEFISRQYRYLYNLAEKNPEYSAVAAYITMSNGDINDEFILMRNSFSQLGKGTKKEFVEIMKEYIMEKARNPAINGTVWERGSWVINGRREAIPKSYEVKIDEDKSKHKTRLDLIQSEEKIREDEFNNKMSYNNYLEAKRLHPGKYPTKESYDIAQKNLYMSKHQTANSRLLVDKNDSSIMKGVIGNEDTEHYYPDSDRKKRRSKIIKRPISKKPIKKVKSCRCR